MGAAENDGSLRAASPPPMPPPIHTARSTQTSYWLCKVWVGNSLSSPAKFSTHFCPAAAAPSEAGTKLQLPTTLDDPINKSPKYTPNLLCTYDTLSVPLYRAGHPF